MTIFERVKEISDLRKISLQALAEKSNMGINSIYGWKTKKPSIEKISAVADILNVSTDYLLGRTDEMNLSTTDSQKEVDIKDALEHDIMLAFDGKPISEKYKRIILELLSEEDD
ncbi:helix-turn-helix transcriptional regulator [Leuconostoc gelidum subsp. gasicomitatum]|uniref:helix-turn-helix domain-containing protein n=1 Tax=Leuconostoc gasicomitatum TaxID=115778 RepID=UPI001CC539C0|nr:helix-turn-helix transcriptional regulator [Leuconostoc gasicomitatum]MBZ5985028.1 helix-turn-helix transcriptional regulator [Leuconostoc gasicomitatum]